MEKIKLYNEETFEIIPNGIHSTDETLTVAFLAPKKDLVSLEEMLGNSSNLEKINLLSENDEVLRIYSGYTVLVSIEKQKDVVIATTITEDGEVNTTADVIYIKLRKTNTSEMRLASLEETVDMLVMSVLE